MPTFFTKTKLNSYLLEPLVKKVKKAGFKVSALLSGPLGGDAQIAAKVADGTCNMVIFFRDPLEKHPHEPDISMLMRLCDVHDIPLWLLILPVQVYF